MVTCSVYFVERVRVRSTIMADRTRVCALLAMAVLSAMGAGCSDSPVTTDAGMTDGGVEACGPANCMGCCDGDRCVSGASLAACGLGGGACEVCAIGAMCGATGCSGGPMGCSPSNCTGCCMRGTCLAGDQLAACGSAGGVCSACSAPDVCASGACGFDGASEWQIEILDATFPAMNFGASSWDSIGAGEADPFVQLRVGSAVATPITLPTIDGTLTPDWTTGGTVTTLSPTVTGADLVAYLRFDMFDEDVSFDDAIGTCRYMDVAAAFDGAIVTLVCPGDAVLMNVGFTLRWRLVRI